MGWMSLYYNYKTHYVRTTAANRTTLYQGRTLVRASHSARLSSERSRFADLNYNYASLRSACTA